MERWVVCPEMSLDIDVSVKLSECPKCGKCKHAFEAWLEKWPKANKTPEQIQAWMERKKHRKGMCPKVRDRNVQCNARRKFCYNAWFCAEESELMITTIYVSEVNMLFVRTKTGVEKSKENDYRKLKDVEGLEAVYSCKKKLSKVTVLVPVAKEDDIPEPKMPKNVTKTVVAVLEDTKSKKCEKTLMADVNLQSFETNEIFVVDKIYQPKTEIKLVEATPSRRRRAPAKKPETK